MSCRHTVVLVVFSLLAWLGCSADGDSTARQSATRASPASAGPAKVMTVAELDRELASGACVVLDANQRSVRIRNGKIPGARLLSHYQDYSLDELPADEHGKLVFYCANDVCRASDAAADKALAAGYADVYVLRAGIMGWVRAGQATEPVP